MEALELVVLLRFIVEAVVAGVAWVEFLGYWEVGLLILQCSR